MNRQPYRCVISCFWLSLYRYSLRLKSMRCRFKKQYLLAAWNLMDLPCVQQPRLEFSLPKRRPINAHEKYIQCLRPVSKSEGDFVKVITAVVSSIQSELDREGQVLGSLFLVLTMSSFYCSDEHREAVYDSPSGSSFTKIGTYTI